MPRHMVSHERLDEEVPVVVTGVHAKFEWLSGGLARFFQQLRFQLFAKKLV